MLVPAGSGSYVAMNATFRAVNQVPQGAQAAVASPRNFGKNEATGYPYGLSRRVIFCHETDDKGDTASSSYLSFLLLPRASTRHGCPGLSGKPRDSVANVQGIGSIPTVRLERKLGRLPTAVLDEIHRALAFALNMETKT